MPVAISLARKTQDTGRVEVAPKYASYPDFMAILFLRPDR